MEYNFNGLSDFSGLKAEMFSPMIVGNAAFDRNLAFQQKVLQPMREQTMQMQKNILALQEADMSMRNQEMLFEQRKQELDMRRKANEALSDIGRIDSLLETGTAIERREKLFDVMSQNATNITNSPELSKYFEIKEKKINDEITLEAKNSQKNAAVRNSFANMYTQKTAGTPLYNENTLQGIIDGTVSTNEVSKIIGQLDTQRATQEAQAEAAGKLAEAGYENRVSDLDNILTRSYTADYADVQVEDANGSALTNQNKQPIFKKEFKSQKDRANLVADYINLMGLDPTSKEAKAEREKLMPLPADELISTVRNEATRQRFQLQSGITTGAAPFVPSARREKEMDIMNATGL